MDGTSADADQLETKLKRFFTEALEEHRNQLTLEHRMQAKEHHDEVCGKLEAMSKRLGDDAAKGAASAYSNMFQDISAGGSHVFDNMFSGGSNPTDNSPTAAAAGAPERKGPVVDPCYSTGDDPAPTNVQLGHAMSTVSEMVLASERKMKTSVPVVDPKGVHLDWRSWEHEMERDANRIKRFVLGPFDHFMGFCILLNTISMFCALEFQGRQARKHLGMPNVQDYSNIVEYFNIAELVFNLLFIVELAIRIVVLRGMFFTECSNFFDAFLVLISCLQSILDSYSFSFLRIFRCLRLLRTLKVVRVTRMFRQLRVLVGTIINSIMSFFWSMVILFILMFMGAIIKTMLLHTAITDEAIEIKTRIWVYERYGTSLRSLYTMFEATFSGGWPTLARPVIEEVSALWAVFWVIYASLVIFAVTRVISALFLRDTLAHAASDSDMLISEQMRSKKAYVQKLKDVLEELDTSGDGEISYNEFYEMLNNPRMKAWLSVLEVGNTEVNALWEMLGGGDGVITQDEFLSGVMRVKGTAREEDVYLILRESHEILNNCMEVRRTCEGIAMLLQQKANTTDTGGTTAWC